MSNFTITNGCNIPLNVQTGTIPSIGVALLDWFQPMVFTRIVKTILDFQLVETPTNINFWGIIQPQSGRQLNMMPEGQRSWNNVSVIAQDAPDGALLSLIPDEVITYLDVQYRVMGTKNYSIYGFVEIVLSRDYTGSGPN